MIAALDSRIYALEPYGPPTPTLPDFYKGFTYHEVGENDYYITEERQPGVLYFDLIFATYNDDTKYVGVFNDLDDIIH